MNDANRNAKVVELNFKKIPFGLHVKWMLFKGVYNCTHWMCGGTSSELRRHRKHQRRQSIYIFNYRVVKWEEQCKDMYYVPCCLQGCCTLVVVENQPNIHALKEHMWMCANQLDYCLTIMPRHYAERITLNEKSKQQEGRLPDACHFESVIFL